MHEKLILTTKDFTWYFQYKLWFVDLMGEKRILTEQRTSLDTFNVNCDLLIWCTRNLFWHWQRASLDTFNIDCDLSIWCTKLILTEQRTSLDTFNIDCDLLIWCARMREKLFLTEQRTFLILSDLLILCRSNLFWQNKGIRLIVLTCIMIFWCMNNLFTKQRASLDTFQYIAICCERNLFWQNKDFAWYLSICCDLLYGKLMCLTRW